MIITVESNVLKRHGIGMEELGILLYCKDNPIPLSLYQKNKSVKRLWTFGYLDRDRHGLKANKTKLLRLILQMRDYVENGPLKERAEKLAPKLRELFPEGKKQGTTLYWKGNRMEVVNKLKKFLSVYGEEFSDEQIITATDRYVKSFNGNYSYMRVLKYFIWKNVLRLGEIGNNIEELSDLLTWLECGDEEDELRQDWTNTLL